MGATSSSLRCSRSSSTRTRPDRSDYRAQHSHPHRWRESAGAYHLAFDGPPRRFRGSPGMAGGEAAAAGPAPTGPPESMGLLTAGTQDPSTSPTRPDGARTDRTTRAALTLDPRTLSSSRSVEVGIAVTDPPTPPRRSKPKPVPVSSRFSPEFVPAGDHGGLLILGRDGRAWPPRFDAAAHVLPLRAGNGGTSIRLTNSPPIALPEAAAWASTRLNGFMPCDP